jgi:hypothetical protein
VAETDTLNARTPRGAQVVVAQTTVADTHTRSHTLTRTLCMSRHSLGETVSVHAASGCASKAKQVALEKRKASAARTPAGELINTEMSRVKLSSLVDCQLVCCLSVTARQNVLCWCLMQGLTVLVTSRDREVAQHTRFTCARVCTHRRLALGRSRRSCGVRGSG